MGTGVSGHIAQILAGSLTHRISIGRPPLPAVALGTDASLISAIVEHSSTDSIFSHQLEALGSKGDMVIAFSSDGDSPAVLHALVQAREAGLATAAFLGRDGGKMKNYTEMSLVVEAQRSAPVHEVHLAAAQILAQLVERRLFSL